MVSFGATFGRRRPVSKRNGRIFMAVWLVLAVGFLAAAGWVTWQEAHRVTTTATVMATGVPERNGEDSFIVQFRTSDGTPASATAITKDFTDEGVRVGTGAELDVAYLPSNTKYVYAPGRHTGLSLLAVASFLLLFGIAFAFFVETGRGPIAVIFRRQGAA